MGRKCKRFQKTLHQLAYEKMIDMQSFGESRFIAKRQQADKDKIFSYNTYKTYWRCIKRYLSWVNKEHPEVKSFKKAKNYICEWIGTRVDSGLSAWTIHTEVSALSKLFDLTKNEINKMNLPERRRENIKRSRTDVKRDKHFSLTNNDELIKFCKGTGCRRGVLQRLEGRDLWNKKQMENRINNLKNKKSITCFEQEELNDLMEALKLFNDFDWFIHHRRDKNGKSRFAPIIGNNIDNIVERMKNTKADEHVWQYVHSACDVHNYRASYATMLYKHYARPISDIPFDKYHHGTNKKYQSGVYICRRDERGKKLCRNALLKVSKALGHNRIYIVPENYLRGL